MAQARGERYLEPMQDHPLDRAVWHALTTRQADLALGGALVYWRVRRPAQALGVAPETMEAKS